MGANLFIESLEGPMPLNIKSAEVERLVAEVARLAGESKTEAVRRALLERRAHIASQVGVGDRRDRLMRFLESEVWPSIPRGVLGRRLSKKREEAILGYGPDGT